MTKPPCSFHGCIRIQHSNDGLCRSHRRQFVAGKSLTPLDEGPLEIKFWWNVDKNGPSCDRLGSKCWTWTGSTARHGYGRIGYQKDGKNLREFAHRVSYVLHGGTIPDGLVVKHDCDNPSCVNPEHLSVGTQSDNIKDAALRRRMASGDNHGLRKHPERIACGGRHGRSLLTEQQVIEIRANDDQTTEYLRFCAEKFGMNINHIRGILNRRSWKHI